MEILASKCNTPPPPKNPSIWLRPWLMETNLLLSRVRSWNSNWINVKNCFYKNFQTKQKLSVETFVGNGNLVFLGNWTWCFIKSFVIKKCRIFRHSGFCCVKHEQLIVNWISSNKVEQSIETLTICCEKNFVLRLEINY